MRRTLGIIALTLACAALALVLVWRWLLFDYFQERYPATLYYSQIRSIDDETLKPVDFRIKWDFESPKWKKCDFGVVTSRSRSNASV